MDLLFTPPILRRSENKKEEGLDNPLLRAISSKFSETALFVIHLTMPEHHGSRDVWLYEIFFWVRDNSLVIEERDTEQSRILYQGASTHQASEAASLALRTMRSKGWGGEEKVSSQDLEARLKKSLEQLSKRTLNPGA